MLDFQKLNFFVLLLYNTIIGFSILTQIQFLQTTNLEKLEKIKKLTKLLYIPYKKLLKAVFYFERRKKIVAIYNWIIFRS